MSKRDLRTFCNNLIVSLLIKLDLLLQEYFMKRLKTIGRF